MYSETQGSISINMTNLERTKLIDRYLSHEMPEEEKMSFERLLSEGDSSSIDVQNLQKEMELQKEIELAIQERGLREMLKKEEARIRQRELTKRVVIWSIGSGSVITALAAVMLLLFVVAPVARLMQDMSSQYVAQVEIGQLRGEDPDAYTLSNALSLMQANEWEQASQIVDDMYAQTVNPQDEASISMHEDAEWLKAICLMHDGKVMKAKRLLRKIANSESPYSEMASEMLERTH